MDEVLKAKVSHGARISAPSLPACARGAVVGLLALSILAPLMVSGCSRGNSTRGRTSLGRLDASALGKRVLIVAPHPDDEGLALAGLIQQCLARKTKVMVVIVTCGEGSQAAAEAILKTPNPAPADYRKIGAERCRESRGAMRILGLPSKDLVFLGYPDGGTNSLWNVNWDYDNLHVGNNGADRSPYRFAYQKKAPYCGRNLVRNLESIIKEFKPTAIVYPDEEDSHHDHWALNAFVQYVLIKDSYRASEYTYLLHRHDFPSPLSYHPHRYLDPPAKILIIGTSWNRLLISPDQEKRKGRVLQEYVTPMMMREFFIEAFIRKNELLGVSRPRRVKRESGKNRPGFSGAAMPDVVIRDPAGDERTLTPDGSGDLRKVSFWHGDKTTCLALEARGPVSESLTYAFHLRIFNPSNVDRLDIYIRNGKSCTACFAHNSHEIESAIPTHVRGKRVWIEIPSRLFNKAGECMLNCDDLSETRRADKTAWQRIELE